MNYQDMAAELAPLGITISQRSIDELEAYDADYAAEYGRDYYSHNPSASKVFDLLYWEGCGFYDEETWEWTPSTSGVFYFDTEAWSVDTMYTDFFTGLSSMNSELNFTNVQEDYSEADIENGIGTVEICFTWNGTEHEMTAQYDYDWFDTEILHEVGYIIASDSIENDLYVCHDGQCCMLFYGSVQQVHELESLTGLNFSSAQSRSIFH